MIDVFLVKNDGGGRREWLSLFHLKYQGAVS